LKAFFHLQAVLVFRQPAGSPLAIILACRNSVTRSSDRCTDPATTTAIVSSRRMVTTVGDSFSGNKKAAGTFAGMELSRCKKNNMAGEMRGTA